MFAPGFGSTARAMPFGSMPSARPSGPPSHANRPARASLDWRPIVMSRFTIASGIGLPSFSCPFAAPVDSMYVPTDFSPGIFCTSFWMRCQRSTPSFTAVCVTSAVVDGLKNALRRVARDPRAFLGRERLALRLDLRDGRRPLRRFGRRRRTRRDRRGRLGGRSTAEIPRSGRSRRAGGRFRRGCGFWGGRRL